MPKKSSSTIDYCGTQPAMTGRVIASLMGTASPENPMSEESSFPNQSEIKFILEKAS